LLRKFGEEVKPSEPRPLPVWDRAIGELRLGTTIIKRVRRLKVATNAILILDGFQELGWRRHLDDPLPYQSDEKKRVQRLHEVVKSRNENLQFIRFRGDGKGHGIVWDYI
jgi:hypothetical protein